MSEKFSLKDHLFNAEKVHYLATLFATADPSFKKTEFISEVMTELLKLELKARIYLIAAVLQNYLPTDYEQAVAVILKSLPLPLDPSLTDDDFGDFIFAPLGEYVVRNGCTKTHLDTSLRALEELTMRFSMEDAIRHFLRVYPNETLRVMEGWTRHSNYHVRRLVSEGTRPLLPWSGRVTLTAEQTIPLLTVLHADDTRYVTRSVANHLNDIAKSNPSLVIQTLAAWHKLSKQDKRELEWMTKHSLRTLIKQGNQEALAFLGYTKPRARVAAWTCRADSQPTVVLGGVLALECKLVATADTKLLIDYVVHFVKKNGTTAPKVFKWKVVELKKGEILVLTKRHPLKADATTFTFYPGEHKVELQINGLAMASTQFTLKQ